MVSAASLAGIMIGAVLTAFAFPVVLAEAGTDILLTALVFTSLLSARVTGWFRIETAGVNLEEIGR
jgi:putative MFS transporter